MTWGFGGLGVWGFGGVGVWGFPTQSTYHCLTLFFSQIYLSNSLLLSKEFLLVLLIAMTADEGQGNGKPEEPAAMISMRTFQRVDRNRK
jgi:hypothetical protein